MPRNLAAAGLLPTLFCLLLGSCARGSHPAQTTAAPDSPAESRLADEWTRLADDYVREYVARFPEVAELSGLQVARHDGLTDAQADWQRFEDRLAERLEVADGCPTYGLMYCHSSYS